MSSIQASNILIFGATGFIGSHITENIIAARPPFASVTVFTSAATALAKADLLRRWEGAGSNVSVVAGDITSEADVAAAYARRGVDTVVSALGRAVIGAQVDLLRWAAASPTVCWFLPSEFGTDVEHGPASAAERPHQEKLRVRRFAAGAAPAAGLRVTYVVTGPYFEAWVARARAPGLDVSPGYDAQEGEAWLVEADAKVSFTTMPDVGKLVVAALQHPEAAAGPPGAAGRALKVNSFVATPAQVLAAYEELTGRKWKVNHIPLSRLIEEEKKLWDEGNPLATLLALRRIWAQGGTLYDKTDNEAIGLGPADMESLQVVLQRLLTQ